MSIHESDQRNRHSRERLDRARGIVDGWRERTRTYPDELAAKMIALQLRGVGARLAERAGRSESGDWLFLYEGMLEVTRRLFLTLMVLNRVWAVTDNPAFKGAAGVARDFKLQPDRFMERVGRLFRAAPRDAICELVTLGDEVLTPVAAQLAFVDSAAERAALVRARALACTGSAPRRTPMRSP